MKMARSTYPIWLTKTQAVAGIILALFGSAVSGFLLFVGGDQPVTTRILWAASAIIGGYVVVGAWRKLNADDVPPSNRIRR